MSQQNNFFFPPWTDGVDGEFGSFHSKSIFIYNIFFEL